MANTAERTKSHALRDTEVSVSLSLHVSRKDRHWSHMNRTNSGFCIPCLKYLRSWVVSISDLFRVWEPLHIHSKNLENANQILNRTCNDFTDRTHSLKVIYLTRSKGLGFLSVAVIRCPDKSDLREKGPSLAHISRYSSSGQRSRAAGAWSSWSHLLTLCPVKTRGKWMARTQFPFSRNRTYRMVPPTGGMSSPLVNMVKIIPHWHI